jgi:hypothetical protein
MQPEEQAAVTELVPRSLPSGRHAAFAVACFALGCADESFVRIARDGATVSDWETAGFTELVTPLRPPTTEDGTDRVTVWLRLPSGGQIRTVQSPSGPRLQMPVGAIAERIELTNDGNASRIEDVRGTEFLAAGEEFHVLVRNGFAWERDDEATQRAVDRELAALVGPSRARRLVAFNRCAACHVAAREAQVLVGEGPHRPTDASGLYHVQAVLADELPLERNRPVDANVGDPHFRARCPAGADPELRAAANGGRHLECPGGQVVWGRYALADALAAGAPHAAAVCASRRFLFDHMDDEGRQAFSSAFAVCGFTAPGIEVGGSLRGRFPKGRGECVYDSTPYGVEFTTAASSSVRNKEQ